MPRRQGRIEDQVGVSYRQFHHWTQLGYIRATRSTGKGKQFQYSRDEIKVARIIGHLVKLGMGPRQAAALARGLRDEGKSGSLVLENGKLRVTGAFAQLLRDEVART